MRLLLALSIVAIALLNFAGLQFEWYVAARWMDIPMHIAGGAWIALAFWYVAHDRLKAISFEKKWLVFAAGVGVVAIVGIFWEIWELILSVYIKEQFTLFHAPGDVYFDTLKDLFDDLVGGALALGVLITRKNKNIPGA
jgi:hypothetical protein